MDETTVKEVREKFSLLKDATDILVMLQNCKDEDAKEEIKEGVLVEVKKITKDK